MKTKTTLTLIAGLLMVGALAAATDARTDSDSTRSPSLSDMEIAHTAYTAGILDIRYAHLALAVSENPDVRAFAETMIRDHSAVNEQALQLLKELKATPQDNPTSQKLVEDAARIRKELMRLEGKAFDKRYADNELAYHQFVNSALKNQFIPNVQNARFKDLLVAALRTFEVHESHAAAMSEKVSK